MPDNALKALIRKTETGKTDPAVQYETIIGHNQNKLAKPLTQMTVGEIIAASDVWRKRFGTTSGAAGAYQIIKPTLVGLAKQLGIDLGEKFTPELQDRMADQLLATRGLGAFLRGTITVEAFGNAIAREWASFPVLSTSRRGETVLKRGQSYYDKFAGNSALIKPEVVEATLLQLRAPTPGTGPAYRPGDADEPAPVVPEVVPVMEAIDWVLIGAAVLFVAFLVAVFVWLF